jgi:prolactin regulatory element-binding protein
MCLAVSPGNKDEEPPLLAEEEPSSAEEATVGPSERKVRLLERVKRGNAILRASISQVIVGINSSLTQSGSNENLRLLKWSSSGYKPSSQTTAAEKLTDAIKEQVKDDAPGQNTRDEDVQEMELQSKAASIQITDLEQYVKVVAVSPNGKFLAVGGTDGQIALHSFPSLERIWIDTPIQSNETVDASFSADSSLIAFVFPRSIRIYPTSTNSPDSGAPPDLYQSIRNPNLKQTSGCVFRGARFGRSGGAGKPGRSDRFYTVVNANPASGLGSSKKDREKAKIRKW